MNTAGPGKVTQPESDSLSKRLARHRGFWDKSASDRPLVGFWLGGYYPLAGLEGLFDEKYLVPDQVEPERLLPAQMRHLNEAWISSGELLPAAIPILGFPWLEAIIGCPVVSSAEAGAIWPEPLGPDLPDPDRLEELALSPHNAWSAKLQECLKVLMDALGGTIPFGTPILRGPTDLMATLMGGTAMILAFKDRPKESRKLLHALASIWIHFARTILDSSPPFQGGYGCFRGIWAPGKTAILQEDASALLSPALYGGLVLGEDRRALAEFPFAMMHNHSGNLPITRNGVLNSESLAAFELTIDPPPAPSVLTLLPIMKDIQASKPLVVFGSLDQRDLELMTRELSPSGLAICVEVESPEEAGRLGRLFA